PGSSDFLLAKRHERDVITALWQGRSIPTAVEGDESAVSVLAWKRSTLVEEQIPWCPVCRKRDHRINVSPRWRRSLAVAAVLGRNHALAASYVEVGIWPPVIVAFTDQVHLLRDRFRVVVRSEELGPQGVQLISSVNHHEQRIGAATPVNGDRMTQATRIAHAVGWFLTEAQGIEHPDAAVLFQERTGEQALRAWCTVLFLAGVRWCPHVHVHPALAIEGKRLVGVLRLRRKAIEHRLARLAGDELLAPE